MRFKDINQHRKGAVAMKARTALISLSLALAATPALAGPPKDCTALPAGQQPACKARVAKECGHLKAYWDKVNCEDKIVKGMDVCASPETTRRCNELQSSSEICDQASSMYGHAGSINPAWLDAVERFPAVLKEVRAFKPSFDACSGKIAGCRLREYAFRACEGAADTFRAKWAKYYSVFKERQLKASWRGVTSSIAAAQKLAEVKKVADINRSPLLRVEDSAVDDAVVALTRRHQELVAEERKKEERNWRKAGRLKKIHKQGKWANCIFSDKPLATQESRTDAALDRIARPARVFVRCYFPKKPGNVRKGSYSITIYATNKPPASLPLDGISAYPKAFAFELTADDYFGHYLGTLREGEHEVSLKLGAGTGKIIQREKIRHITTKHGTYDTERNVEAGLIFAKGAFTYAVSAGQDEGLRRHKEGMGRKEALRRKMMERKGR
jgi:hypothetical protein